MARRPSSLSSQIPAADRAPAWQRRKSFRQPEILDAAVSLLEDGGFEALATTDIARRAGVSEATIYKYFETRDNLINLAIEVALRPLIEALEDEIPRLGGVRARLHLYVAHSLQDMGARPNVHRSAHGHLRWSGTHKSMLREIHRRFARLVGWILDQAVHDGEVRPDTDLVLAGDMVFAGIEGAGWRKLLQDGDLDFDIETFSARFVSQLLDGIEAAAPASSARGRGSAPPRKGEPLRADGETRPATTGPK